MKKMLATILMLITQMLQSSAPFSELDDEDPQKDRPLTPLLFAGHPSKKSIFQRSSTKTQPVKLSRPGPPQLLRPTSVQPKSSPIAHSQKPSYWNACCCLFFARQKSPRDSGVPKSPGSSSST